MINARNQIVIIGGNDAGLSAAGRVKRLNPAADLVVLEKTAHTGYASCGLCLFLDGRVGEESVAGYSVDEIASKRGIRVETSIEAKQIDSMKHRVVCLQNGRERTFRYGKLLLALGATPVVPEPLDLQAENVFILRNFDHVKRIYQYTRDHRQHVLIVGAGLLGLEVADALAGRGMSMTMVDKSAKLLPKYFKEPSAHIASKLKGGQVRLILEDQIESAQQNGGKVTSVTLAGGECLNVDLIIVAAGIVPNTALAQSARIPLGRSGAIAINKMQETKRLDIFAAGDCAESRHVVSQKNIWLPYAGIAAKQGRVAGSNLAGQRLQMPPVAGSALVRAFGLEFGHTGLDWEQAQKAGFDPVYTVIQQKSKPDYIANAAEITVALIADRRSKKVLGGQIVATDGAGMRLNILATALSGGLTLEQLEYLDFGYTPEINALWEPLSVAANNLSKKLKK